MYASTPPSPNFPSSHATPPRSTVPFIHSHRRSFPSAKLSPWCIPWEAPLLPSRLWRGVLSGVVGQVGPGGLGVSDLPITVVLAAGLALMRRPLGQGHMVCRDVLPEGGW